MPPQKTTVTPTPSATKKKSPPKPPAHLWLIHGKLYDFSSFVKYHPGGETMINVGKGRDCTELFESVHALCDHHPRSMIEKYRVDATEKYEEMFSWDPNGFYSVLTERVRRRLAGENYKATWGWWIKIGVMVSLLLYCLFKIVTQGSYMHALLYGVLMEMIGFCGMHDASHGAVSKKSYINHWIGVIWNSWTQWSYWLWMQHHVLAHHSYTGVFKKDPDVVHYMWFIRKHKSSPHYRWMKYQHYYWWIIVGLLPNQHLGQTLVYNISNWFGLKLFGMPLMKSTKKLKKSELIIQLISFFVHAILPLYFISFGRLLLCIYLSFVTMGISYFLCVATNHDTYESHEAFGKWYKEGKKVDWGEVQVRSSGNHSVSGSFLDTIITQLWGGMNYQIEHHLFPSLSHCHYHKVAPIVQQTCKEFNIPYPAHKTWLDSIKSYVEFVKEMGQE